MNVADVMDELAAALDGVTGLRVFPYWVGKLTPPAAVVSFPSPLTYDAVYQRAADRAEFPVTIVVGKVDARSARDQLAQFLDGAGSASVKTLIEAHETEVWSSVRVTQAEVAVITIAGTDYLGAEFLIDVLAGGA